MYGRYGRFGATGETAPARFPGSGSAAPIFVGPVVEATTPPASKLNPAVRAVAPRSEGGPRARVWGPPVVRSEPMRRPQAIAPTADPTMKLPSEPVFEVTKTTERTQAVAQPVLTSGPQTTDPTFSVRDKATASQTTLQPVSGGGGGLAIAAVLAWVLL